MVSAAQSGEPAHIRLMPDARYQTIAGFGQGSMDQANPKWFDRYSSETLQQILDRLYTLEDGGLGLSICRTYMTAGDAPGHAHMGRQPDGSKSPHGYEPEPGVFAWDGHEKTLWHAQGAARRGATMVAFWNSCPYWLTIDGCTAGSPDGWSNNMRAGEEARFAEHMCAVLKHYRDAWGIDFDYVSPINEPEWNYWKEGGGQDGCHVSADQAIRVAEALDEALKGAGLRARIQMFEAARMQSLNYLDKLLQDQRSAPVISTLTTHEYIANEASAAEWAKRAAQTGKGLWMSEWGDWKQRGPELDVRVAQALGYAKKIHMAMRQMRAQAWCMWEPQSLFDQKEDGLDRRKSFWAVAHYSRFARPGTRMIEAEDSSLQSTAYLDEKQKTVALVTVNATEEDRSVECDVSRFAGFEPLEAWQTSSAADFAQLTVETRGSILAFSAPARSITSILARVRSDGFRRSRKNVRPASLSGSNARFYTMPRPNCRTELPCPTIGNPRKERGHEGLDSWRNRTDFHGCGFRVGGARAPDHSRHPRPAARAEGIFHPRRRPLRQGVVR
ncbi:MAG: hypothetical protein NTW86_18135 [Candidatus Sumerlaeota bacterium]|nr:hypothetical protein [Candidatus Sumerlaeota bacterium]